MKTPLSFLLFFLFLLFSAQEKEYSYSELKKELNSKTFVALISESCAIPIGMKYTYCEITFKKNMGSVLYTMKLNDKVQNVTSLPKKYKPSKYSETCPSRGSKILTVRYGYPLFI